MNKSVEKGFKEKIFILFQNFSAGIFTSKSMKQLEYLFDKVYIIPKKEWMSKFQAYINDLRYFSYHFISWIDINQLIFNFLVFTGFALNSILIDERLGFTGKGFGQSPRFAIIPLSTPTLKNALIQNGYEVSYFTWQK